MALDPVLNFAKVTVNTGYDAAATSIVLVAGQGAKLPETADGDFNLTWWNSTDYSDPSDDPNVEIVRCTARSTDTLTVTRNQESSGASTKNTADKTYKMVLGFTKKSYDEIDSDYQPIDDALTNISGLAYASDSFIKFTAEDTYTVRTLAETIGDLSGVASGTFSFNDQNLTSVGTLGVGAITTTGSFSQTGATTFGTGTGAISLNGSVSIASAKTFKFNTGATVGTIGTTFADNDTSLMTSQAIKEKIENYSYVTGAGAITAVEGEATLVFGGSISLGGHAFDDIDITAEFTDTDDHIMSSKAIKAKIEDYGYSTGGGITWNEVTGTSQSASVDNGYICNNASLVTVTLPDTAALGSVVRISGKGAGGWKVAQNAGETIHFGNTDTTAGAGGYLEFTNRYDAVELLCTTANTDWVIISSIGNITIN